MQNNKLRLRRFRKWAFGLIAFAVLVYAALQPYFVSRAFRRAYRNRDFAVAEGFVDFPTLRENMLQRAKNSYKEPATKNQAASMYNLAHAFKQKMIESIVRPGGFEALAKMNQSQVSAPPRKDSVDLGAWNTYEGLHVFTTELYVQDLTDSFCFRAYSQTRRATTKFNYAAV